MERKFKIGDHDYIYNSSYGTELDRAFKKVDDLTKSCTFINGVAYIPLHIENVIFNNPATIVFWSDGSKTVVKCKDEAFDEEKGLAMAISKKVLGNKGSYFNEFKKWLPTIEACEDKEERALDKYVKALRDNIKPGNARLYDEGE